jgi:hypothetical protein
MQIIAWLMKNMALIVGIVEAIIKAIAGIVSMTATKKDDEILKKVDDVFSAIKGFLYNISDKANG